MLLAAFMISSSDTKPGGEAEMKGIGEDVVRCLLRKHLLIYSHVIKVELYLAFWECYQVSQMEKVNFQNHHCKGRG